MEYKGYNIAQHSTFASYTIKHIGRGSTPKSLDGSFTKPEEAMLAIDRVPDKKPKRGK